MSRRREVPKREILPDPKFGDIQLAKFINALMMHGKKSVAENIIYDALDELAKNNAKLTADLELANEKFNKVNASGDRRDVGNLALSKPKRIERIERKREQQRARCFEIAQGSPLTEEEKNATKKSQINAECTNIANPNYVPN